MTPCAWQSRGTRSMVQTADNLRIAVTADGGILLDIARGRFFRLNPWGSRIIEILQKGKSIADVVDQISHECTADIEIVRLDVQEFIQLLEARGLVQTDEEERSRIGRK
jgi:Coenzyme PQQ synthesis protein D (PqqD)